MGRLKNFVKSLIGKSVFFYCKKKKPKNTAIIYAGPLLGDAIYSMAFIEEFKSQNPEKKIVIWTTPQLRDIISTFYGYDKIISINSSLKRILLWQIWNSDPKLHSKALYNGFYNEFALRSAYPGINEITLLRDNIFRVGCKAALSYHRVVPKTVKCIANFYENCNKIIVLNPYSNTTHLSNEIFGALENLAKNLQGGGASSIQMSLIVKNPFPVRKNSVAI